MARHQMAGAQERMRDQANRHRREPDFVVGDRVLILKKVWSTDRPSDKLEFPLTKQSFLIKGMKGSSYELEVPDNWRGSRVFHAKRLRRAAKDPLPS